MISIDEVMPHSVLIPGILFDLFLVFHISSVDGCGTGTFVCCSLLFGGLV